MAGRLLSIATGVAIAVSSVSFAMNPGVPALPATTADYVQYAVGDLPEHFASGPVAAANNTPVDNAITNDGATLGRVLFYDKRLSHDNGTSCSSCHQQQNSFDDSQQFSEGFDGGLTGRSSTPLANAAYYARGRMFWDERAASVEEQVLGPIQDAVEMGTNLDQLRDELAATDFYPELFERAFGDPEITNDRISKALSQFVRSMASYQSRYDEAVVAGTPASPDFEAVLTEEEQRGQQLFHGAGQCSQCHSTHAQIGDRPRNIGLDLDNSADVGAGNGEFKTMSLRNVAARERFMHDGRFSTLEEVVEFYNSGVQDNPDLDLRMRDGEGNPRRLNLSEEDKQALVAFMETFTDYAFLTSSLFSDPFETLAGDYNSDGSVDDEDYQAWVDAFGSNDGYADGNGDGTVDIADYTLWRDNYGKTWADLAFVAVALPGDFNGDGFVDDDDYQMWSDGFGSGQGHGADGNGDGTVDIADYTIWRDNYGTSWRDVVAQAVPEPGACVLLAIALAFAGRRIR